MSDYYLGEIRAFPFNRVPTGFLPCDGRQMNINQNQALYSLLGITYGGDGKTYFNLPDLRGRTIIGRGTAATKTVYPQGQAAGTETVALVQNNIPQHTHTLTAATATMSIMCREDANVSTPAGNCFGKPSGKGAPNLYAASAGDTPMSTGSVTLSGSVSTGGTAHANMQPYMALNYCIVVSGYYPQRQ